VGVEGKLLGADVEIADRTGIGVVRRICGCGGVVIGMNARQRAVGLIRQERREVIGD